MGRTQDSYGFRSEAAPQTTRLLRPLPNTFIKDTMLCILGYVTSAVSMLLQYWNERLLVTEIVMSNCTQPSFVTIKLLKS